MKSQKITDALKALNRATGGIGMGTDVERLISPVVHRTIDLVFAIVEETNREARFCPRCRLSGQASGERMKATLLQIVKTGKM